MPLWVEKVRLVAEMARASSELGESLPPSSPPSSLGAQAGSARAARAPIRRGRYFMREPREQDSCRGHLTRLCQGPRWAGVTRAREAPAPGLAAESAAGNQRKDARAPRRKEMEGEREWLGIIRPSCASASVRLCVPFRTSGPRPTCGFFLRAPLELGKPRKMTRVLVAGPLLSASAGVLVAAWSG
jgi:hypothetical protein